MGRGWKKERRTGRSAAKEDGGDDAANEKEGFDGGNPMQTWVCGEEGWWRLNKVT
jgi:hypothetical protein